MSEIETTAKNPVERGFFGKLANGDFGLAKTYWLYGVLAGVIFNRAIEPITSTGILSLVTLTYTAYKIPVIIGTWRAANKYQGWKMWAILAKIATIIGAISLSLIVVLTSIIFLMGKP